MRYLNGNINSNTYFDCYGDSMSANVSLKNFIIFIFIDKQIQIHIKVHDEYVMNPLRNTSNKVKQIKAKYVRNLTPQFQLE